MLAYDDFKNKEELAPATASDELMVECHPCPSRLPQERVRKRP